MLYCVPGFGLGTNFHWLPSQCSIRVRCKLSAPAYCPTDHASLAESAVAAVSRPSAPTPGLGTLVQPFASCTGVTLGEAAGVVLAFVLAFVLVFGLHAASNRASAASAGTSAALHRPGGLRGCLRGCARQSSEVGGGPDGVCPVRAP